MKKVFILISGLIMISFIACGPRNNEEKQKKTEDSAFQKERNTALDNANKILSDSPATVANNQTKKEIKKKK